MVDLEEVKRRLRELYGLSWFTDEQVDKLARHLVFAGVSQPLLLNYNRRLASFLVAPASAGHHLAVKGGLAIHSMNVTDRLLQLSGDLKIACPFAYGSDPQELECRLARDAEAHLSWWRRLWHTLRGDYWCEYLGSLPCARYDDSTKKRSSPKTT